MPRLLNGFDDQERNLTFVKTDFQVLNSNLMTAILSKLSIFFITKLYFYTSCQTCMCKLGIYYLNYLFNNLTSEACAKNTSYYVYVCNFEVCKATFILLIPNFLVKKYNIHAKLPDRNIAALVK